MRASLDIGRQIEEAITMRTSTSMRSLAYISCCTEFIVIRGRDYMEAMQTVIPVYLQLL